MSGGRRVLGYYVRSDNFSDCDTGSFDVTCSHAGIYSVSVAILHTGAMGSTENV